MPQLLRNPSMQAAGRAISRIDAVDVCWNFFTLCHRLLHALYPLSTLHRAAPVAWRPFHFFAVVLQLCGVALRLSLCPSDTRCSCNPSPCVPCLHADAIPSHAPPLNPGASDVSTCPPAHLPYYVCRPRPRMHCLNTPILFLQFTRIAPYPCMRNCPSFFPVRCADPSLLRSSCQQSCATVLAHPRALLFPAFCVSQTASASAPRLTLSLRPPHLPFTPCSQPHVPDDCTAPWRLFSLHLMRHPTSQPDRRRLCFIL